MKVSLSQYFILWFVPRAWITFVVIEWFCPMPSWKIPVPSKGIDSYQIKALFQTMSPQLPRTKEDKEHSSSRTMIGALCFNPFDAL